MSITTKRSSSTGSLRVTPPQLLPSKCDTGRLTPKLHLFGKSSTNPKTEHTYDLANGLHLIGVWPEANWWVPNNKAPPPPPFCTKIQRSESAEERIRKCSRFVEVRRLTSGNDDVSHRHGRSNIGVVGWFDCEIVLVDDITQSATTEANIPNQPSRESFIRICVHKHLQVHQLWKEDRILCPFLESQLIFTNY